MRSTESEDVLMCRRAVVSEDSRVRRFVCLFVCLFESAFLYHVAKTKTW